MICIIHDLLVKPHQVRYQMRSSLFRCHEIFGRLHNFVQGFGVSIVPNVVCCTFNAMFAEIANVAQHFFVV